MGGPGGPLRAEVLSRMGTEDLGEMLVCPSTMMPLRPANPMELGVVRDLSGRPGLEAALVREDGLVAYPVEGGIPVMLKEAALDLRRKGNTP